MKKDIKLLVMDVDGVLTDGKVTYNPAGEEIKSFHVRDGYGIKQLHKASIKTAIITGRKSSALLHRTKDLDIEHVYMGIGDKLPVLKTIAEDLDVPLLNIAYVGDDLPDLEAMQAVAYPITVANGEEPLKQIAKWVTQKNGGEGAVREICDWILADD
jgi:3-deoxy-D-manno-octulosonate 8-phosphate phosphatase (KDO 8-P phosphatase)